MSENKNQLMEPAAEVSSNKAKALLMPKVDTSTVVVYKT